MDRFLQIQIYNTTNTAVQYDNAVDTDWGISAGTAILESSIMDTELCYGIPYASMFEVQIYGLDYDLAGRKIQVKLIDNDNSTTNVLFTGWINSSKTDYMSTYRDLIAYDWFFFNKSVNVAPFWNTFWTNNDTTTLGAFRTALLQYVATVNTEFSYTTPSGLINESMTIENNFTNQLEQFDFDEALRIICELQLCCPHINGNGVLEFITLGTTTKSVTNANFETSNSYWEDFTTAQITGIGIYDSDVELAQLVGTNANVYNVAGNVFMLDKDASDLTSIGNIMLNVLRTITYTPIDMSMIISDFDYKLGDYISTPKGNFYIFGMNFSGSQFINQNIFCRAQDAYLSTNIDAHNAEIIQGNKTAKIFHDINALRIEYTDLSRTISNNYYTKSEMATQLSITAQGVMSQVSAIYQSKTDASAESTRISSLISQMSEKIVLKVVTDSDGQHLALVQLGVDPSSSSSYIQLQADNVDLKASDILNLIAGQELHIGSGGILEITSDNFTVDEDGHVWMTDADISGSLNVTEGGTIGNFTVDSNGSIIANLGGYSVEFASNYIKVTNTVTGQYSLMSNIGISISNTNGTDLVAGINGGRVSLIYADSIEVTDAEFTNVTSNTVRANTLQERYNNTNYNVISERNVRYGTYTGTFNSGILEIDFEDLGITSRPTGMVLTPNMGGAILLNYMYAESTSNVVIWGSDSSSWGIEGGGWLEGVEVTFSYMMII